MSLEEADSQGVFPETLMNTCWNCWTQCDCFILLVVPNKSFHCFIFHYCSTMSECYFKTPLKWNLLPARVNCYRNYCFTPNETHIIFYSLFYPQTFLSHFQILMLIILNTEYLHTRQIRRHRHMDVFQLLILMWLLILWQVYLAFQDLSLFQDAELCQKRL